MEKLTVVKIGGKVIDSPNQLAHILADFSSIEGHKVLVHGGGSLASSFMKKMGIAPKMVDGRRITDEASLDVVIMIYAGLINKQIVAALQANQCNAIGLSGADGNSIKAKKREGATVDFGFVGDIEEVNVNLLTNLVRKGFSPVFSAITHDNTGQLLNTNADTIAAEVAKAMSTSFDVSLIMTFEQKGVLSDPSDPESLIETISYEAFKGYQQREIITDGMIPKLDNGFDALKAGVKKVIITSYNNLADLSQKHTELYLS